MTPTTILGIDPGTKEMGLVVLRGQTLVAFGVHTLRNGGQPYDLIGQARAVVFRYIRDYAPQVVAIEKPLAIPTKRGALLLVMDQELHARSLELNLSVQRLAPDEIRQAVVGNPRATKIEVAEKLVRDGFEQLRGFVPKRPVRAALGLSPKAKYWLHMFDALALAVAASRTFSTASFEEVAAGRPIEIVNKDRRP